MNQCLLFVKKFANKFGIEVSRFNVYSSNSLQMQKLLTYNGIGTVFDVGANIGQYAIEIRSNGFKGKIYSFEPQSAEYSQLTKLSLKDPDWFIFKRVAIGDYDGEVDINVSENSLSSSVLPIMDSHVSAEPRSVYIGKETVPIKKLDSIAGELQIDGNIFLKIDVQGFELNVLEGAKELLRNVKGVQLELSLINLYEGQVLMEETVKYLGKLGFHIKALFPCFIDAKSGQLLQLDGVFFK